MSACDGIMRRTWHGSNGARLLRKSSLVVIGPREKSPFEPIKATHTGDIYLQWSWCHLEARLK
eukprot:4962273-Amphidinium_carterae.2